MQEPEGLFDAIKEADSQDHVGYLRYLCELYLKDHPDHGQTLVRYASSLIALAQYSEAKASLDHAHAVVPKKWLKHVLTQRGHLLEAHGDFAAAEKVFMEAHKLDPEDATYLIFAAHVAFRRGDLARAEALARQATKCPEGCIDEAFFNLGGYLVSMRRYREAVDCYRKALEIDPDYALARERLNDVGLILKREAGLR